MAVSISQRITPSTTGMVRVTHLILLIISLLSISKVSGDSYTQSWRASERLIPMDEIKADCNSGQLTEVKLSVQGIPTENHCAGQGPSFFSAYKQYLQDKITECFEDTRCTKFYWSRDNFIFGCDSEDDEKMLQQSLNLIITVTCEAPNTLHVYHIDSSTKINASRPVCDNGQNQKVEHIFTMNPCPKDMALGYEAWYALYSLAATMEACGELCPPINTDEFKLQTLACESQTEVKNVGIGIYWSCDSSSVTRPFRTTTTPNNKTGNLASQTGADDESKEPTDKYLVALIAMSLLFALCLFALVLVLVYFLYCRGKRLQKKFTMPAGRRPPSKDTLYGRSRGSSQRKLLSSRTPSSASSERYVSEKEHNSRNAELAKLNEDYAVPIVMSHIRDEDPDRVIYENEDDTYEIVDVEKPTMSPPQRTNTTQSGYTVMGKKPTRDNSEKYSDGYLIPTAMRKSNNST